MTNFLMTTLEWSVNKRSFSNDL